jgi:hypothetical protein
MTNQPDGFESLGLTARTPGRHPHRPWWLIGQSLRSCIVSISIWAALFLLWLVEDLTNKSADWFGWVSLTLYGIVLVATVPSMVHFARLRKRAAATD